MPKEHMLSQDFRDARINRCRDKGTVRRWIDEARCSGRLVAPHSGIELASTAVAPVVASGWRVHVTATY